MPLFDCLTSAPFRRLAAPLILALCPLAAQAALPSVGEQIGASAEEVKAAMTLAGCPVENLAVEQGKVAATCRDTAGSAWKVVIDPTTGRVTHVAPAE